MTRMISRPLMFALLLCGATVLRGSEADELRDRAQAIQKAAAILAKTGIRDVSERLEREAGELLREADRREARVDREAPHPDIDREIGNLKERLQDLLSKQRRQVEAKAPERDRAVIQEKIADTERALHALKERLAAGRPPRPEIEAQTRKIEEAGRRLHHLRVAAENLKAAGMHDVALKLTEQAEHMERDVREAKERLAREMDHPGAPDPRDAEIRELRQENERLHAEIRELHQHLEKR